MTGLGLSFPPCLGPHRSLLNLPLPLPACQNPQHPPASRECIPLGVWTGGSSLHFTDSLQVFLIPWVTTSALSHLCPPLQDTPTPTYYWYQPKASTPITDSTLSWSGNPRCLQNTSCYIPSHLPSSCPHFGTCSPQGCLALPSVLRRMGYLQPAGTHDSQK